MIAQRNGPKNRFLVVPVSDIIGLVCKVEVALRLSLKQMGVCFLMTGGRLVLLGKEDGFVGGAEHVAAFSVEGLSSFVILVHQQTN